jgi:hypothetical protein
VELAGERLGGDARGVELFCAWGDSTGRRDGVVWWWLAK